MKNNMPASTMGAMSPRAKGPIENTSDLRGQFGAFLYDWLERHLDGDEEQLAEVLGISGRAVRKWMKGRGGPVFQNLDDIAVAMDFEDSAELLAEVKRYCRKHRIR